MATINTRTAAYHAWGDGCDAWRLVTSAGLGVILERVPPGRGEVRHRHRHARQVFFVLSGVATFELGEQTFTLEARDAIEVAPGVTHSIRNQGTSDLEFLVIAQPDSLGDREPA